jgi:hypothetical protein
MTDTWESTALIEETWESSTTPGTTFTTVYRDSESTGGSFDGVHNDLDGRDTATAHPISAITGLQDALDSAGGGAVDSVNGETGTVTLDAADVDAIPNTAAGTDNDLVQRVFLGGDGPVYGGISPSDFIAANDIATKPVPAADVDLDGQPLNEALEDFVGAISSEVTTQLEGLAEQVMAYVAHGSDDNVARPVGFASVTWYGTVFPGNWVDGDQLIDPDGLLSAP